MALQNPLLPAPAKDHSLPTPAAGLTGADLARLRHSLDSSISDNTRKMYVSAWRSFEAWAQGRGALALPASPPLIAAYLAHLAQERRLSVATVRLHRAALAAVHKAHGPADPTNNEAVRQIMKGIARAHGRPQKQAKPLTAEALAAVKATAKSRRSLGGLGNRQESAERASWRAQMDVALLATLAGWVTAKVRGCGPDLGRRGVPRRRRRPGNPAPVQNRPGSGGHSTLRRQGSSPSPAGHQASARAAEPRGIGLRNDHSAYRQPDQGGGKSRRPRRGLHWTLRPRRHGPGPGEERRGTAGADDRRPVEIVQDAGPVHRAPGSRPGRSSQVLSRAGQLTLISTCGPTERATTKLKPNLDVHVDAGQGK